MFFHGDPPSLDGHLPGSARSLSGLGHPDLKDSVLERRLGLVRLHLRGKAEGAHEGTVHALVTDIVLLLDLLFLLLLRDLRLHDYVAALLVDVRRGGNLPGKSGPPRPPGRLHQGEGPAEEVLEPPLELLERGKGGGGFRLRKRKRPLLQHDAPPVPGFLHPLHDRAAREPAAPSTGGAPGCRLTPLPRRFRRGSPDRLPYTVYNISRGGHAAPNAVFPFVTHSINEAYLAEFSRDFLMTEIAT